MKNRFHSILFLLLILIPSTSLLAKIPSKHPIILIDTRLLLLAHPLFAKFDLKTRRFKGTRSEPVQGESGKKQIADKLQRNIAKYKTFLSNWGKKLQNTSGRKRKALELTFLKQKSHFEKKISEIRQHYWAVSTIPGHVGLTEPASIITQVLTISKDMRDAILILKKRYKSSLVIDVSSLLPSHNVTYDSSIVINNQLYPIIKGKPGNAKTIAWLKETKKYWLTHGNLWNPFIVGTVDKRKEAVKIMLRLCKEREE